MRYLKKHYPNQMKNLVVVSPDVGGAQRGKFFAKKLGCSFAIVYKERDYSKISNVQKVTLIGEVKDKNCLLVDDMIDTAGTITNAAKLLKEQGAKEIFVVCSHAMLHGVGLERIDNLYKDYIITTMITTDTIYRGKSFEEQHKWYKAVSVAPFFASVIYNINHQRSVSELLKEEYAKI